MKRLGEAAMKRYRLIDCIRRKMTLIVSIPENDPETAKAVQEAGADAIKVHLNCHHRASGTHFGSWNEEKAAIQDIPALLDIPAGIVPGAETVASLSEMKEIADLGFDFLDIFAHHMPVSYLGIAELTKVIATDYRFTLLHVPELEKLGLEIIEASIIEPEGYGQALSMRDLVHYSTLVQNTSCPVFIPTQRKIAPSDIPYLHRLGAGGIAIGAVVTGKQRDEIVRVTGEFRAAIDALSLLEVGK